MLPANNIKRIGYIVNLTDTTLEFTKLENEGIKSCGMGVDHGVFCSLPKFSWNLKHLGLKVQVVPYFERQIGKTSTFSTFIG